MEQEYSKNMIYGNYRSMENQAFPIDCETLSALQNNTKKLATLGHISGCNKLILTGCNIAGLERKEGYVFVVNTDNPMTGEILYYKGGSSSSTKCHISEEQINVTADGTDFPNAYTIRILEDGVAGTPMNWSDFVSVKDINNLKLYNSIKTSVDSINTNITEIKNAIATEVSDRNIAIEKAIAAETNTRKIDITSLKNRVFALELGEYETNTFVDKQKGSCVVGPTEKFCLICVLFKRYHYGDGNWGKSNADIRVRELNMDTNPVEWGEYYYCFPFRPDYHTYNNLLSVILPPSKTYRQVEFFINGNPGGLGYQDDSDLIYHLRFL